VLTVLACIAGSCAGQFADITAQDITININGEACESLEVCADGGTVALTVKIKNKTNDFAAKWIISGYGLGSTVSESGILALGNTADNMTLKVEVTQGKTVVTRTLNMTVKPRGLLSIAATFVPKTSYIDEQTFVTDGLVITGTFESGNLRAGDILLLSNGKTIVVEKIRHEILENPINVYNFEGADNHNYFVAGNTSAKHTDFVLVHNSCGGRGNAVIGKLDDLKCGVGSDEYTLLDQLSDKGSPKLNWKQNSGVLCNEMTRGIPIGDASAYAFERTNTGFLRAERELLKNHGWRLVGDFCTKLLGAAK
jgi:hypothetical protein